VKDTFRFIRTLVACYIGVALVGLGITLVLRDDPRLVDIAVWVRDGFMAASGVLLYVFAVIASRGSRGALKRLRVVSVVIPLAIVVLIVLPDPFPIWMKVQQGVGAVCIASVALIANLRSVRADER
jgi:hypothetical protein